MDFLPFIDKIFFLVELEESKTRTWSHSSLDFLSHNDLVFTLMSKTISELPGGLESDESVKQEYTAVYNVLSGPCVAGKI